MKSRDSFEDGEAFPSTINIGMIYFKLLARYCKLYRANIGMSTFSQYWPILAVEKWSNMVQLILGNNCKTILLQN